MTSYRDKILPLDLLVPHVERLKADGKTVVQAHGTFDLLHLGHYRHLETARSHGDVLIVSITADAYVNKGPGRPVFKQDQRAEMLAALQVVDYVAVLDSPDSVDALSRLKPHAYVKGQDYENPEGDVTGKIIAEREAVEAGGGRLVITHEQTFSSSELINRHINLFEPHVRATLDSLKAFGGLARINDYLERVKGLKVLIVGDAIIDEYRYVRPMGKSPKENMITARYQDNEVFAGGVFAAANHVASFSDDVTVLTALGERDTYEAEVRAQLAHNVTLKTVTKSGGPTTCKSRYVESAYMRKLFEVYFFDDDPMPKVDAEAFNAVLSEEVARADMVIVTDFGHGLLGRESIDILTDRAKFLAVNAQSNSANLGFNLITKYRRADFVCIDAPEARLAVADRVSPISRVASTLLPDLIDCSRIIITHGNHGCVTHEAERATVTIPALADKVVDTVGAGDAFFVVSAPLVAVGCPLNVVGLIGNVVGALKVGIVGHRKPVDKASVVKSLTSLLK